MAPQRINEYISNSKSAEDLEEPQVTTVMDVVKRIAVVGIPFLMLVSTFSGFSGSFSR